MSETPPIPAVPVIASLAIIELVAHGLFLRYGGDYELQQGDSIQPVSAEEAGRFAGLSCKSPQDRLTLWKINAATRSNFRRHALGLLSDLAADGVKFSSNERKTKKALENIAHVPATKAYDFNSEQ